MVFAPPITMFVAAPKAFTVVAVVLNNAIVELPAMMEVVNVGEVANTAAPVPVSPVTADARFADDGVTKKSPTPVPIPVILLMLVTSPEMMYELGMIKLSSGRRRCWLLPS